MKIIFKRVLAYLIDIVIVTIISTLLVSNKYVNTDYEKYQRVYKNYNKEYNSYDKITNFLEKSFNNNKIEEKEIKEIDNYDDKYQIIIDKYYKDGKITSKEYNKIVNEIKQDYLNVQTTNNYKLIKYSKVPTIISILTILLYFVVIQFYFDGKTVGKKIMRIKVIAYKDKKLTLANFFIRSLLVNEVFINILNVVFFNILSKNNYIAYNQIIYMVTYLLEISIVFSILLNKDSRGIHDYISNTKVIEDKKE